MSELDITEQLVRYLDGDMPEAEHASWEARIAADPALGQELRELQWAREVIQLAGTSQKVGKVHQEMTASVGGRQSQPAPIHRMRTGTWMRVAAAITVLVMLTAGWWVLQTTDRAIYQDHMIDFAVSNSRNQGSQDEMKAAFNNKDFSKVVSLASQARKADDSLLTGISFLKLGQYTEAVQWLQPLRNEGSFKDDADYYYAFAMLAKGDRKEALRVLETIHGNADHIYHSQVTPALLRKLRFTVW